MIMTLLSRYLPPKLKLRLNDSFIKARVKPDFTTNATTTLTAAHHTVNKNGQIVTIKVKTSIPREET